MAEPDHLPARAASKRFFGNLRFPKLFVIVVLLFLVDLVLPDFIPFIDELILGALALMLGMLKDKVRGEDRPPPPPAAPPAG